MLRRDRWARRASTVMVDAHEIPLVPGGGLAVYETAGRVIVRVVDGSDGPGVERCENHVVDGYPALDPAELATTMLELAATIRSIALPDQWPSLSAYSTPLVETAPRRFRSYRSWQRATRSISVAFDRDSVRLVRMHADLARGSWLPVSDSDLRAGGFSQRADLVLPTDVSTVGAAMFGLLAQPPIAG